MGCSKAARGRSSWRFQASCAGHGGPGGHALHGSLAGSSLGTAWKGRCVWQESPSVPASTTRVSPCDMGQSHRIFKSLYLKNKMAVPQVLSHLNIGGLYGLFTGIKKNSQKKGVLNIGLLCYSFFDKCTLTFNFGLITCNHHLMAQDTKKGLVSTKATSHD